MHEKESREYKVDTAPTVLWLEHTYYGQNGQNTLWIEWLEHIMARMARIYYGQIDWLEYILDRMA